MIGIIIFSKKFPENWNKGILIFLQEYKFFINRAYIAIIWLQYLIIFIFKTIEWKYYIT